MNIPKIVLKFQGEQDLNNATMADKLCENLKWVDPIKRQTVFSWTKGISIPQTDFLVWVLVKYRDWRFDFALACLIEKNPEVWGDDGEIWKINREMLDPEAHPELSKKSY